MKKWMYELLYRLPLLPIDWIFGSTEKIEEFVELGIDARIDPCKAITLGCGEGRETIYLAKKGFDVIGLDFSETAIKKARRRARAEGVEVPFIVDDLTDLQHVNGNFDLVTDFGAINDMSLANRDQYMENVLPLMHDGSRYLMFCFEKMLPSNEVKRRFDDHFIIEELYRIPGGRFPGELKLYLMTKGHSVGEKKGDSK